MGFDLKSIIPFAIAILYALTIHEFFHAWTANKLGDPTAKMQGRLTLNPLAHLDPVGTICFIIAHFGWGKPVPVNPAYFKHPRRDDVLVSAAGPISNIISALLFGIIFQILYKFTGVTSDLFEVLKQLILINLILAFFNFIPLYPLDGSHILKGFLPRNMLSGYETVCRYGPFILLGVILLGNFARVPIISYIIWPPTIFFMNLFMTFLIK
jgi:Zn-dependent protease